MRKPCLALILALTLLLCACAPREETQTLTRYTYSFFGTFDTFVSLTAYAATQEEFDAAAKLTEEAFTYYHHLFDPYVHWNEGNNIWSLNNGAWKAPMTVEPDLMELLVRTVALQKQIPDTVDVTLGSVLRLWHDARETAESNPYEAYIPEMDALEAARAHTGLDLLVLDEEANTVYYLDEGLRLDPGAVAKGFAAAKVAEHLQTILPRFSLNAGGNLICGGAPENETGLWRVGVQDPDASLYTASGDEQYVAVLGVTDRAVVTSGDYQRYYMCDGIRCHHIIDPATLMPAVNVRAVTVVTEDFFIADYLSTAAFLLPYERSRELIASLPGTEALWVLEDGTVESTEGFAALAEVSGTAMQGEE